MSSRMLSIALALAALAPHGLARADAVQVCDDGAGLAVADGTVLPGDYPGGSAGVGNGFGGQLGAGVTMSVDSDAMGNLGWATQAAAGCTPLNDAIVIYIDSIPGVGITNTSQLNDTGDPGRIAISGFDGTNSADLGFAAGFGADYAVVIEAGGANLFRLSAGAAHTFVRALTTAPSAGFGTACVRELSGISMTDLSSQAGNPFRWVATLISPTAFRANEFQGIVTAGAPAANIGQAAYALANGSFNVFRSTPSPAAFRGGSYYTDFDTFVGGFAPAPTCGQLDSTSWAVTGMSDGALAFGGTNTAGDYNRGVSPGGATTGGFYSFRVVPGDGSLGIQPGGSDLTPGTLTFRTLNATTSGITAIAIDVTFLYNNNEDRSQRTTLAYSLNGTDFIDLPSMAVDTPEALDTTGWVTVNQTVTVGGISVAPGAYFTLRWTTDDLAGANNRDELAIGAIHLKPTYSLCGNGTVDTGEACDAGAANGTTTCGCQSSCTFAVAATACGAAGAGLCDAADTCDGAGACVDRVLSAGTECRASSGTCDVAETCSGTSAACPADGFAASGVVCLAADPTLPCDADDTCNGSGVCTPRVAPATQSCRASTGVCDLGAMCDGTATSCPASAPAASSVVCRASTGGCDLAESCTGTTLACPSDALAAAGVVCAAADPTLPCDVDDVCTGSSAACTATFAPSTTECRASTGACDLGASCSGTGGACPASAAAAAGTACRASAGDCDVAEACDGTALTCPANAVAAAGVSCRAAAGDCDVAEVCDGSDADCPADAFAASTVECRAAVSSCDSAEACTGSSADCPADVTAADGTACDDGDVCTDASTCTAGACNGVAIDCDDGDMCTADSCDATGTCGHTDIEDCCLDGMDCDAGEACVDNVCVSTTDAGMSDAGTDAGTDGGAGDTGPRDGGLLDSTVGADTDGPGISGGCGCRASGGRSTSALPWLVGLVGLLAYRRRR